MINFLIKHHSQKYSTRRPNTQLYLQSCYRKQKIKKFINPQSKQQQNASPSTLTPYRHNLPNPNQPEYSNATSPLSLPHPNTAEYRTLSAQPFSIAQHRQIQKSTSAQPHTSNTAAYIHKSTTSHRHNQELLKKSPRGVQRGRGFTAPLRFSFFPKNQSSSNKQISFFRLFLNIFIQ